jgi:hypothetical protein
MKAPVPRVAKAPVPRVAKAPAPRVVKAHERLGELFQFLISLLPSCTNAIHPVCVIQVPKHIRQENNNQKQREIDQGGTRRSLVPVQLLTDSTNVPHQSDEDDNEDNDDDNNNDDNDNNDNNNNNNNNNNNDDSDTSGLDFGPVEPVDSSTLLPPLFIPDDYPTPPSPLTNLFPTSSSNNKIPAPQGNTNDVNHSKLQRMFGLGPAKAEMGQKILKACPSRLLNPNLQWYKARLITILFTDVSCK